MFNAALGLPEPIQGYPKPQPPASPPKRRGRPPKQPQHSQSLSPITEPVDSSAVDDFINDYKLG